MTILITSGCSFSDTHPHNKAWPSYLSESLNDCQSVHLGMTSQGNGLISRKLIHKIIDLLKDNSTSDLLVGIMWSGINRHDFYNNDTHTYKPAKLARKDNLYIENPTGFVNDTKKWIIFNNTWTDIPECNIYYRFFENAIWSQILTVEHVLRTQWFLEKHNIKYFMTTYTNKVFDKEYVSHPEVEYLYKQVNFDNFLPVEGEFEWCINHSNLKIQENLHPSSEQHELFTEQVIIPFLKEKQYI